MLHVINTTTALTRQINAVNVADLAIETKAATVVTMRHHHSVSGMSSLGGYSGSSRRSYFLPGLLKRWLCLCCGNLKRSWQSFDSYEPMWNPGMFMMPPQPVIVRNSALSLSDY